MCTTYKKFLIFYNKRVCKNKIENREKLKY